MLCSDEAVSISWRSPSFPPGTRDDSTVRPPAAVPPPCSVSWSPLLSCTPHLHSPTLRRGANTQQGYCSQGAAVTRPKGKGIYSVMDYG